MIFPKVHIKQGEKRNIFPWVLRVELQPECQDCINVPLFIDRLPVSLNGHSLEESTLFRQYYYNYTLLLHKLERALFLHSRLIDHSKL